MPPRRQIERIEAVPSLPPSEVSMPVDRQPRPVFAESERFSSLAEFAQKKELVHTFEAAIQGGQMALDKDQRQRAATSKWELDRIVLYLAEEYDRSAPDYPTRLLRVRQEFEKLRAVSFEASLMP